MGEQSSRRLLIGILQLAYSGELAASYAYQGHWKSVGNPEEKDRIRAIEQEEWEHEKYFRSQVLKSALGRRLPMWQAPPPKENIRLSFTEAGA